MTLWLQAIGIYGFTVAASVLVLRLAQREERGGTGPSSGSEREPEPRRRSAGAFDRFGRREHASRLRRPSVAPSARRRAPSGRWHPREGLEGEHG